ncbi:GyrI-like domain-containing protein [Psychrobacter sp. I-STPA6b]|uniref:GyrI-like domain-containing protein n=1 Tax=Psychrobacter sp. I-STPA6b TaxID=2585718 RepID=UPI001D0CDCD9|nr:GyrI-like domain-containing protein [Psychrobacter sp. I-STPA6b]
MSIQIKSLATPILCQGLSVRTTNQAETSHKTAKLGGLWQKFYQTQFNNLPEDAKIYGMYHNYETDATGEFDVVAGWNKTEYESHSEDIVTVTIPAGKYLVFTKKGAMPDIVIEGWDKVWNYFNKSNCEHTRLYDVDFEHYVNANPDDGQVDIYIGIE